MTQTIKLCHGTTATAAERILVEGWQAQDLSGRVGELAGPHGLSAEDVLADLKRYNSFAVLERGRGEAASFVLNFDTTAWSWAQRAPELDREVLWAIWRVKFSGQTEPYHWNQDVPGAAWVLEQMSRDELVVLEVETTVEKLLDRGAQVGGFARGPLTRDLLPILSGLPEIAFLLPYRHSGEIVVHEVDRCVGWDVFAHWLGLDREEFIELDQKGVLGPAGVGGFEMNPWWPLKHVDQTLRQIDEGVALCDLTPPI